VSEEFYYRSGRFGTRPVHIDTKIELKAVIELTLGVGAHRQVHNLVENTDNLLQTEGPAARIAGPAFGTVV